MASDSPASVAGRWDGHHGQIAEPLCYGDSGTYELGAQFLAGCALVEDWGCGGGWLSKLIEPGRYRGIDGSASPFAERVVDLRRYRSQAPGIFMRHVLEHNEEWALILSNAIASFTERFVLILFTPLQEKTRRLAFVEDPGVPDIGFARDDLTGPIEESGAEWNLQTVQSGETHYGVETVIRAWR